MRQAGGVPLPGEGVSGAHPASQRGERHSSTPLTVHHSHPSSAWCCASASRSAFQSHQRGLHQHMPQLQACHAACWLTRLAVPLVSDSSSCILLSPARARWRALLRGCSSTSWPRCPTAQPCWSARSPSTTWRRPASCEWSLASLRMPPCLAAPVWLHCLACSVLPPPQVLHAAGLLLGCAPPSRYNNI